MKHGIWNIDKLWFKSYAGERLRYESGEMVIVGADEAGLKERLLAERPEILAFDGDSATININGPLSQAGPDIFDLYFGYGGTSYAEWQDALDAANARLSADGVITQRVNTPGGEVTGVEATANKVREIAGQRAVNTVPVGMMASAGIWTTAHSTKISAEEKSTLIGSVGVATQIVDWSEYYSGHGVQVHDLTNDASPDKRPDVSTDEGRQVIRERLNDLYDVFIGAVLEGRGSATSREKIESLKGTVVTSEKALEIGFIDEIVTSTVKTINPPAQTTAGEAKGKEKMTLEEFLSQNPAAAKEIEAGKDQAREDGRQEERDAIAARSKKAMKIINSDAYPEKIKSAGIAAITGERTMQSFDDFVSLFDMQSQDGKSKDAAKKDKEIVVKDDDGGEKPLVTDDPAKNAGAEAQKAVDDRLDKIAATGV